MTPHRGEHAATLHAARLGLALCSCASPVPTGRSTAPGSTARPGPRWFEPRSPIGRVHGDASMFVGRHPGGAAADPAPGRDAGRRRALRLPRRHVGPAGAHQPVPRGDHLRHRRGRPAGRRRGPLRSTRGSPARCPTARRTPPPTRTCCCGCTSPRWTASCGPTSPTGSSPLDQAGRDTYVAQTAEVARRLGVPDPPTTEAELDARLRRSAPSCAAPPEARDAVAYLLWKPPLPLVARPPYGVLMAAAHRADAALDPAAAAAALAAGHRARPWSAPSARRRPARSAGRWPPARGGPRAPLAPTG